MYRYSTRAVSRILLFSCGLFFYTCLGLGVGVVRPVGAHQAPKTWFVCVAGLNYYRTSYAFEAGALKACSLLAGSKSISDNVIVISPDSAAYDVRNTIPGKLIYGHEGLDESVPNEYDKVNVTYNSQDMTVDAFYGILSGNSTAVKGIGPEKVIKSGPEDTIVLVFINVGRFGFMTLTNNEHLYAEKFVPFLEDLMENKHFKQMLILVDGMSVGSMFDGYLCTDCNIIVMTNTAKQDDSMELCHFNADVAACTSTCYMFFLLQQLEMLIKDGKFEKTTLFDLYQKVRTKTWFMESNSNLYGHLDLGNRKLSEFFSPK